MAHPDAHKDPESFAAVQRAFLGARFPLDGRASKVLRLMLEGPDGCDALLSADRFEMRFAWHPSRHRYYLRDAPPIVSQLLTFAGAEPGTRRVQATIGPETIPAVQYPLWSFQVRHLWMDASDSIVSIQIRNGALDVTRSTRPDPLPEPIEQPARFLDVPSPCHVRTALPIRLPSATFVTVPSSAARAGGPSIWRTYRVRRPTRRCSGPGPRLRSEPGR